MSVRLGYHPATWGPGLDGLWRGIDCMAACGWEGFEYCCRDIAEWYDRPREFRRNLDEHGIGLSALYIASGFGDAGEVAEHRERVVTGARFCVEVGCGFVLIDGGARKAAYEEADFIRVAEAANECGEICRDAGLLCSWHQHWGTMFEYGGALERLLEMTDPELVLFTPDTAQLALGGIDVVETVRRHAGRVRYIHFKDLGTDRRFIELGHGTVDFPAVWEALGGSAYEGWVVVDLDYTDLEPDESCRINKRYLVDLVRR